MNLDDRLRAAYKAQLQEQVDAFEASGQKSGAPLPSARRVPTLAVAAALVVLLVGIGVATRAFVGVDDGDVELQTGTTAPVVAQPDVSSPDVDPETDATNAIDATDAQIEAGETSREPAPAMSPVETATDPTATTTTRPTPPRSEPDGATDPIEAAPVTPAPADAPWPTAIPTPVTTAAPTAEPSPVPTPTAVPTATPEPTATPLPEPTATAEPTPTATPAPTATPMPEPTATSEPTATPDPQTAAGVANAVCPSGFRAELELASLRYVGASTGWGRLYDLVDEQDGPYYFQAWEPGFPTAVTVEVLLAEPVLASDIRVAQDPFTPISGSLEFTTMAGSFSIAVDGTEGWRTQVFTEPILLDSFTITRDSETENIMEVLVCLSV